MILLAKPDRLLKFIFGGVMRINNFYSSLDDYEKTSGRRYILISRMVVHKKRPAIVIELIHGYQYQHFTYKLGISGAKEIVKAYNTNQP